MGVNAGTLSRYIAGETEAGYETLRQIWEVLDRWGGKRGSACRGIDDGRFLFDFVVRPTGDSCR
ncbi:hypothetical protein [Halobacterium salinarum]|uniref:hypothetical protein n=1 Tax=Halobacterium salinarum TaxID=2242 RepID=UPI003D771B45